MEEEPRTRRWFRFSLRTMFVVITAAALWLAYATSWDRQRQAMLEQHGGWGDTWPPLPLLILCKPGVQNMILEIERGDRATLDRARRLFPETDVEIGCIGPRQ